jgi:hypothetical protein
MRFVEGVGHDPVAYPRITSPFTAIPHSVYQPDCLAYLYISFNTGDSGLVHGGVSIAAVSRRSPKPSAPMSLKSVSPTVQVFPSKAKSMFRRVCRCAHCRAGCLFLADTSAVLDKVCTPNPCLHIMKSTAERHSLRSIRATTTWGYAGYCRRLYRAHESLLYFSVASSTNPCLYKDVHILP